jgi:hypothetical protein
MKKTTSHHTNEWFENHKKIDEYIKLSDFETRNKLKTNMCKEGDKCKRKNYCFFAHTEKEKRKSICSYGSKCRRFDCRFEHTGNAVLPEYPKHMNVNFTIDLSDEEEEEDKKKRIVKKKKEEKDKKKLFVKLFKEEKELVDKVYDEMSKSPVSFKKTKDQEEFFNTINITPEQVKEWEKELVEDLEYSEVEKKNIIKEIKLSFIKESEDSGSSTEKDKSQLMEITKEVKSSVEDKKSSVKKIDKKPKKIIFDCDSDSEDENDNLVEIKKSEKKDIKKEKSKDSKDPVFSTESKNLITEPKSLINKLKIAKRQLEILCSDEDFETVIKMLKVFHVKEI